MQVVCSDGNGKMRFTNHEARSVSFICNKLRNFEKRIFGPAFFYQVQNYPVFSFVFHNLLTTKLNELMIG